MWSVFEKCNANENVLLQVREKLSCKFSLFFFKQKSELSLLWSVFGEHNTNKNYFIQLLILDDFWKWKEFLWVFKTTLNTIEKNQTFYFWKKLTRLNYLHPFGRHFVSLLKMDIIRNSKTRTLNCLKKWLYVEPIASSKVIFKRFPSFENKNLSSYQLIQVAGAELAEPRGDLLYHISYRFGCR